MVETIASAYAIEQKQKLQHILSSQQLISCDMNPSIGLNGCKGGELLNALQTLKTVSGRGKGELYCICIQGRG